MANYNTFILIDTKSRKILLTTSSARKCKKEFVKGNRVDVWNSNNLVHKIYSKNIDDLNKYQEHEEHKKFGKYITEIRTGRACIDYEF